MFRYFSEIVLNFMSHIVLQRTENLDILYFFNPYMCFEPSNKKILLILNFLLASLSYVVQNLYLYLIANRMTITYSIKLIYLIVNFNI